MPAASLRALLDHAIDYAGLFPPASLELLPALENQAQYVRSADRWMLGAFILPVAKFEEARRHLARFDREHPLQISALGPKTENAIAFRAAITKAAEEIELFGRDHGGRASIVQFEMPLPADLAPESLGEVAAPLGALGLDLFWEAPAAAAEKTIVALETTGAGFKLRTGGVTADAFPTSEQIARALVAAVRSGVPIKFTAGLHHPVRKFHESVGTKMHGFLNVLGAGLLAAEQRWDVPQTAAMLEDEEAASFSFREDGWRWREWEMTTAQTADRRRYVRSLGSCSFDEPRDDLRALSLF